MLDTCHHPFVQTCRLCTESGHNVNPGLWRRLLCECKFTAASVARVPLWWECWQQGYLYARWAEVQERFLFLLNFSMNLKQLLLDRNSLFEIQVAYSNSRPFISANLQTSSPVHNIILHVLEPNSNKTTTNTHPKPIHEVHQMCPVWTI